MKILKTYSIESAIIPSTMHALAPLLEQREGKGIRCLACTRRCLLPEQGVGFCTAIVNYGGELYSTAYGVIGEVSITPIENRPVYHYRPGTRTLCLGGLGCNLRCAFCQNWEVAFRDARNGGNLGEPNLEPERAVALALEQHCDGIAWTFNEPTISPMYLFDSGRLAQAAGLYTVLVTNGLMSNEALDLLGPYIDVYRVDIKSLDRAFYRHVANIADISDMLAVASRAQKEYGIHVEVVTNLMPSLNDSDEHLTWLATAIVQYLGVDTPWHLTTYVPYAHMTHIPPTPPATLARAHAQGLQAGLRFVYTDDIITSATQNTICPTCGTCVIERVARHVSIHELDDDGSCKVCGTALGIVTASSRSSQREGLL